MNKFATVRDRGRYIPEPEEADAVDDGPSELPPQ